MKKAVLLILTCFNLMVNNLYSQEVIEIAEKGISNGTKNSMQQDRDEAILDAKIKAIEKCGVQIESQVIIENYELRKDWVESRASAYILPGFTIVDIGYTQDGTYQVVLVGKVTKNNSGKKSLSKIEAIGILNLQKIEFNGNEVYSRICQGDTYTIELYIMAGFDLNRKMEATIPAYGGAQSAYKYWPLQLAIIENQKAIIKLFINNDIDINAQYEFPPLGPLSPLIQAINKNNFDIVKILIDAGAKDIVPGCKYSIVLFAINRKVSKEIIDLLKNKFQ